MMAQSHDPPQQHTTACVGAEEVDLSQAQPRNAVWWRKVKGETADWDQRCWTVVREREPRQVISIVILSHAQIPF